MTTSRRIEGLFAGAVRPFAHDARPTGMYKQPLSGPVMLGPEGLANDAQADRGSHGGPEKALHHFPAEHYAALADAFPGAAGLLRPGTLGENLSTRGLTERDVHVGDVFALGRARVQLSQPRRPCWKIDARLDTDGAAAFIQHHGIPGWYYRVLEAGTVAPDDAFALLERNPDAPTVRSLLETMAAVRPPAGVLERLADLPALNGAWRKRIRERLDWLARRG